MEDHAAEHDDRHERSVRARVIVRREGEDEGEQARDRRKAPADEDRWVEAGLVRGRLVLAAEECRGEDIVGDVQRLASDDDDDREADRFAPPLEDGFSKLALRGLVEEEPTDGVAGRETLQAEVLLGVLDHERLLIQVV